jgi:hypothetical protein
MTLDFYSTYFDFFDCSYCDAQVDFTHNTNNIATVALSSEKYQVEIRYESNETDIIVLNGKLQDPFCVPFIAPLTPKNMDQKIPIIMLLS